MPDYFFRNLLSNPTEYRAAVQFWRDLWNQTDPLVRQIYGWREPWLNQNFPDMMDANPIFSAYSPLLQKGIRVIQYPPSQGVPDFQFWLNTFGGDLRDPESVRELVIACALSDETSSTAAKFMDAWLAGALSIEYSEKRNLAFQTFQTFPLENYPMLYRAA